MGEAGSTLSLTDLEVLSLEKEKKRGKQGRPEKLKNTLTMAGRWNMCLVLMVAAVVALMHPSDAATYVVGDSSGWSIPSSSSLYTTWASNKTFSVGDILVFNFANGNHDVAEVTKTGYDGCSGSSPISSHTSSPASITLAASGDHYYICTFSGHCGAGQKLQVTVTGASSPAPAPTTKPPTVAPPTPSPTATTPPPASAPTPTTTTTSSPASPSPSTNASPPTTGSAGNAPTTAPPPNAAAKVGVVSLSAALLGVAVAFIY